MTMHALGRCDSLAAVELVGDRAWRETPLPARSRRPGDRRAHGACRGRAGLRVQGGRRRQAAWAFREPIATLTADGKTVGRHYAGPTWEHIDGSAVVGKVAGSAPGATRERHPLAQARSDLASRQRRRLAGVTTVQRINTQGRQARGRLRQGRQLRSMPYAADYVFLRRAERSRSRMRRTSGAAHRLFDRGQRGIGLGAVGAAGLRHVGTAAAALAAERFARRRAPDRPRCSAR